MKAGRARQLERRLADAEATLTSMLKILLPRVADSGEPLFFSSRNLPDGWHGRWLPRESDGLYDMAEDILDMRQSLGLDPSGSTAARYLAACAEAASDDPHRRGPRALAADLLRDVIGD